MPFSIHEPSEDRTSADWTAGEPPCPDCPGSGLPTCCLDDRPWAQTFSGRVFPLVKPEPSDVYWPDVIYALAHENRFAGHVGTYSVAQHSILVGDQLPQEWRLYGYLHDGHEFVIGDFTTPASHALQLIVDGARYGLGPVGQGIRKLKSDIDRAIYIAAGLEYPVPLQIDNAVHIADVRAMMTERRDLMRKPPKSWGRYEQVLPLPDRIVAWSPTHTIARFMLALGDAGLNITTPLFVSGV